MTRCRAAGVGATTSCRRWKRPARTFIGTVEPSIRLLACGGGLELGSSNRWFSLAIWRNNAEF